ncbi:MAG: metallophosphoesterase, partial [Planctomycetaceae bacterium]|nr:metallophosphoesterase [Planctomycetaceae bacterium]
MRAAPAFALACWILLAGCGERKKAAPVDFVAYGDCRHQPKVHRKVAAAIAASGAKLFLVSGDLTDAPEEEASWAEFRDIVKDVRARGSYYCAFGDHDGGDKSGFMKEMGMTKPYFDKVEGDYHLFVLDSRDKFRDAAQVEWLKKTARASTSKHKFAIFHHPPFMIDRDRGQEADAIRPNIHPVLAELKFCAAICGHQHAFYSTLRDGVRYVVTAGGGAPLWKIDPTLGAPGDLSRRFHHFVGLKDRGPKIEAHVIDEDGVEAEDLA